MILAGAVEVNSVIKGRRRDPFRLNGGKSSTGFALSAVSCISQAQEEDQWHELRKE